MEKRTHPNGVDLREAGVPAPCKECDPLEDKERLQGECCGARDASGPWELTAV
jgi:hypothetical protein